LLNAIPTNMNILEPDEKSERPGSSGSLGRMLAEIKYDETPRAERTKYFEEPTSFILGGGTRSPSPTSRQPSISDSPLMSDEKRGSLKTNAAHGSFKQFILDTSPDVDSELAAELKQVRTFDGAESIDDEPDTPRQATMGAPRLNFVPAR
jgi:hypothetical protein